LSFCMDGGTGRARQGVANERPDIRRARQAVSRGPRFAIAP
jgi:hypothetical protein